MPLCSVCGLPSTIACGCGDSFCHGCAARHQNSVSRFGARIRRLLAHEVAMRDTAGWTT